MSFPAYEEYKDSEVEWLGDVPKHWDVNRCRRLFEIKKEIAGELGYDVFSITQNGFRIKDIESGEGQLSMDYSKYQLVHPRQFAMNPMDLITGGADIAQSTGVTSPDYRVFQLRPNVNCDPSYLLRVFQNCYRNKIFWPYGRGSAQLGRWRFPRQQFNEFSFPIPPLPEQRTIASFLDAETSKIDGLVSEQRRLIELLQEKRQAVISHAVTKGLNPDVRMKPSGIPWLGDVPEHWVTCCLRRYVTFIDGDRGSEYPNENDLTNEGVLFLSSKNIVAGRLDLKEAKYISPEKFAALNRGKALDGDLIVKVRGSTGRIGELAIFDVNAYGFETAFINAQMMIIRTNDELLPKYLRHVSQSFYWMEQLSVGAYGTAQQQLSNKVFSDLYVVVPPVAEQVEVSDFLDAKVGEFDVLQAQAERAIELLQERRTALISAAVTGKIDVRGYATEAVA